MDRESNDYIPRGNPPEQIMQDMPTGGNKFSFIENEIIDDNLRVEQEEQQRWAMQHGQKYATHDLNRLQASENAGSKQVGKPGYCSMNTSAVQGELEAFGARHQKRMSEDYRNRFIPEEGDDADQPTLQSPAPELQEYSRMQKCLNGQETSAEQYEISHVIKGLKHQESCRPVEFLVHQDRDTDKAPFSCSHASIGHQQRSSSTERSACLEQRIPQAEMVQVSPPPDKGSSPHSEMNNQTRRIDHRELLIQQMSIQEPELKLKPIQQSTQENCYDLPKRSVDYLESTAHRRRAARDQLIGSGLVNTADLEGTLEELAYPGARTPVRSSLCHQNARSKSHSSQAFNGCIPATELQAHLDRMLRQNQQISLSPFQKSGTRQPHFESLYNNMQLHHQLSPFNGTAHVSASKADLTPSTPLAASAFMPNPLAQSMANLRFSIQQEPGASQYEILLKEKAEQSNHLQDVERLVEDLRKQNNHIRNQLAKQKFELVEKDDDLDEAKQKVIEKETRLNDVKDTMRRQNEQIDELRVEVTKAQERERVALSQVDGLKKKSNEMLIELEGLRKREKQRLEEQDKKLAEHHETSDKDEGAVLQAKIKEIYALTVELGCIREENNELQRNIEMQRIDFTERLQEQRERSDSDYCKLEEDFQVLKIESEEASKDSRAKLEALTSELENAEDVHKNCNKDITTSVQELKTRDHELMKLKQTLEVQTIQIESLTTNQFELNEQMEIAKQELEKKEAELGQFKANAINDSNQQMSSSQMDGENTLPASARQMDTKSPEKNEMSETQHNVDANTPLDPQDSVDNEFEQVKLLHQQHHQSQTSSVAHQMSQQIENRLHVLQDYEELSLISENSQRRKNKPIHNFNNQVPPIILQESTEQEASGEREQISGLGEIQNNDEGIDMFSYFREDGQPPANIMVEADIDPPGLVATYYQTPIDREPAFGTSLVQQQSPAESPLIFDRQQQTTSKEEPSSESQQYSQMSPEATSPRKSNKTSLTATQNLGRAKAERWSNGVIGHYERTQPVGLQKHKSPRAGIAFVEPVLRKLMSPSKNAGVRQALARCRSDLEPPAQSNHGGSRALNSQESSKQEDQEQADLDHLRASLSVRKPEKSEKPSGHSQSQSTTHFGKRESTLRSSGNKPIPQSAGQGQGLGLGSRLITQRRKQGLPTQAPSKTEGLEEKKVAPDVMTARAGTTRPATSTGKMGVGHNRSAALPTKSATKVSTQSTLHRESVAGTGIQRRGKLAEAASKDGAVEQPRHKTPGNHSRYACTGTPQSKLDRARLPQTCMTARQQYPEKSPRVSNLGSRVIANTQSRLENSWSRRQTMNSHSRLQKLVEPHFKTLGDAKIDNSGTQLEEDDDEAPLDLQNPQVPTTATHRPSPSIQEQTKKQFDLELQPRKLLFSGDVNGSQTARVMHNAEPIAKKGPEPPKKENIADMKSKLQSIQTGKAYLEKKIQEYETRLSQMKIKKDKSEKFRGCLKMVQNNIETLPQRNAQPSKGAQVPGSARMTQR